MKKSIVASITLEKIKYKDSFSMNSREILLNDHNNLMIRQLKQKRENQ